MLSLEDALATRGSGRGRSKSRKSVLSKLKKEGRKLGLVIKRSKSTKTRRGGRLRKRSIKRSIKRSRKTRRRRGRGLVGGCGDMGSGVVGGSRGVDPSIMGYYQNLTGGRRGKRRRKSEKSSNGSSNGSSNSYLSRILDRDYRYKGDIPECLEWGEFDENTGRRACLTRAKPKKNLKPEEDQLKKAFENYARMTSIRKEMDTLKDNEEKKLAELANVFQGLKIFPDVRRKNPDEFFESMIFYDNKGLPIRAERKA